MLREHLRIVFVVGSVLATLTITSATAMAQAPKPLPPGAAVAVQPPVTVEAPARPPSSALVTYVPPTNAGERSSLAERIAREPCVAPLMSVTRMFDISPLERPKPLATMRGDRGTTLGRVSTLLRDRGFAETSRDMDTGELRATRADTSVSGARDDVLVWMDGQAGDATRIRVYLQYGRYEPFFGSPEPQRVRTTDAEAQQRIGPIREAILSLAAETP